MKGYLTVAQTSFKQAKKEGFSYFASGITFFIICFVLVQMWRYIYGSGIKTIAGFSIESIIWYLLFTELITFSSSSRRTIVDINNDIKSGKITCMLNKPYNYFLYSVIKEVATSFYKYIILCLFSFGCAFLFCAIPESVSVYSFIFAFILGFGGCVINAVVCTFIGIIGFWLNDSGPFFWIYQKLFLVFGVIFPPAFFPKVVEKIIFYSPLYATFSGPATVFANFSWQTLWITALLQIAYLTVFVLLGLFVYKIAKKKVSLNGG